MKSRLTALAILLVLLAGCGPATPSLPTITTGCAPIANYLPEPSLDLSLPPTMQELRDRILNSTPSIGTLPNSQGSLGGSGSWLTDWYRTCNSSAVPVPQDQGFIQDVCSFQNQMQALQGATESGLQYLVSLADESPSRSDLLKVAIFGATYVGCRALLDGSP